MTVDAMRPTPDPASPRAARRGRAGQAYVSEFHDLTALVKGAGLMERRYGFYWTCFGGAALALGAIITGVVLVGDTWLQLLLAAALALVLSQLAFLAHEACHRQIFRSPRWNEWTGRILSGLFAGISYGWWMTKHTRHHANPNRLGHDPDIASGAVAFTDEAVDERRGIGAWLVRRQGLFFLPLLTLEGLSLHVSSVRQVLGRSPVKRRPVEIAFLATRWAVYLGLVFWLLPPGIGAAFVGVQVLVFGFLLGGAFAPNHIGMPIVPRGTAVDFLRRQVLMSRNISGGPVVRFFMGGLADQVEHHLFPAMARPNLRRARRIVRAYCQERQITYTETSLWRSYRSILGYLDHVGLQHRTPFACPMVQEFRV